MNDNEITENQVRNQITALAVASSPDSWQTDRVPAIKAEGTNPST